ncbi:LamG domain-containing protein [Labilithrix luteola]|nr:LamG domain-containing protein [Labilithrix luteola]
MAVDESGHGHGATYDGGIAYGVAGAIAGDSNTAVRFDGTKGLDVGNVFRFDGVLPFSLEVWVKPSPSSGYAVLLARDTDPNGYALYLGSSQATFERQTSGNVKTITGTAVSTSNYNHLVGTFDGSRLRLYVNGEEVASGPSVSSIPGASSNFYIGTENASSAYIYKGDMDEPAVYDHALTAERIRVHYQAGLGTNK